MNKPLFLTVCTAAILLTGCQDTVNTVENANKVMVVKPVQDSRIITDSYLKRRLLIKSLNVSRTADDFMRVQLEVYNDRTGFFSEFISSMKGQNPYKIQYKFMWLDQNGMNVNSVQSDWHHTTIRPGETIYLQAVAPQKNCNDFKINLQEENN